jgi:hypothetical protein
LFRQRITVRHYPVKWPAELNLFDEQGRTERLAKAVLDQDEWLPIVSVGSSHFVEMSFTNAGETLKSAGQPLAGGLEGGVKGLDPFKRLSGLGGAREETPAGLLTAEWIEYEIRSPGQPARTIRREVFDLLGPAARADGKTKELAFDGGQRLQRGLTLLGETEILPVVCRLSADFVEELVVSRMLDNSKIVPELLRRNDLPTNKESQASLAQLTPLPGELHALALARWERSRFCDDLYLDRPNVFAFHRRLVQAPDGKLMRWQAIDIVENDVAVRPADDVDPFLVRMEQGILDTNAEAQLMGAGARTENAAQLFSASAAQGVDWLTIRGSDDANWKLLKLPNDVRTRIARDVSAGYVVVVPKAPISWEGRTSIGWWRVDPTSGQTLGMGARGWGLAATEFTLGEVVAIGLIVILATGLIGYQTQAIREFVQSKINSWLGRGATNATGRARGR